MRRGVAAVGLGLAALTSVGVAAPQVTTLLATGTTWDGTPLAYPAGAARVTAMKIRLEEGDAVAFHCHPVPTFGYVLEGSIRVRLKSGRERLFHQGEALAEVVNTLHKGVPVGGPVEFVVFYARASGMEVSLAADDPRCREQPPGS